MLPELSSPLEKCNLGWSSWWRMALLCASGTFLSPLHLGVSVASSDGSLLVLKAYLVDILSENHRHSTGTIQMIPQIRKSETQRSWISAKGERPAAQKTQRTWKGGESGGLIKVPGLPPPGDCWTGPRASIQTEFLEKY